MVRNAGQFLEPRVDRRKPWISGSRPPPGYSTMSLLVATISGSSAVAAAVSPASRAPMLSGVAV